jgi:hypothetical protein
MFSTAIAKNAHTSFMNLSSCLIHKRRGTKQEIWQQGFHDWTIRDAADWLSKTEYIAMNPVRAGLVETFRSWPYSSASGKFVLDPMPERFLSEVSGAKAPPGTPPQGLKPLPPNEKHSEQAPPLQEKAAYP